MIDYPQFIKESLIGKFIEYTQPFPTPEIFRKWAAVSCAMGCLERRVWIRAAGTIAYPSHYILLVAPPGVGKSRIIDEVESLWLATGVLQVAPQSATKAAMVDALMAAQRTAKMGNETYTFHSLQVAAPEFGVLIPAYDNDAMSFYNIIWDCRDIYRENRRHGEHKETIIDYPQINMLAGTQPAFLGALLPPDAFGMGFTARLVMVYCGVPIKPKLFGDTTVANPDLKAELVKEVKRVVNLNGEMTYTQAAKDFLTEWHEGEFDGPDHPRLETYSVRRIVTIQKLAMGISAACGNDLVVDKQHLEFALQCMLEAELEMPDVFKGMNVPETSNVMAELHNFMIMRYAKTKNALPEHMVIDWLKERVEVRLIDSILKHMITASLMKEDSIQKSGTFEIIGKRYIPLRIGG